MPWVCRVGRMPDGFIIWGVVYVWVSESHGLVLRSYNVPVTFQSLKGDDADEHGTAM